MNKEPSWSEDQLATIRKMWDEGNTALEISKQIGKSRSAVLAKARRLKLKERGVGHKRPKQAADTPAPVLEPIKRKKYKTTTQRARIANTAYGEKTSLVDLKSNQCRWPVGDPTHDDFMFCGAQCGSKTYCEKHASIAYS